MVISRMPLFRDALEVQQSAAYPGAAQDCVAQISTRLNKLKDGPMAGDGFKKPVGESRSHCWSVLRQLQRRCQ